MYGWCGRAREPNPRDGGSSRARQQRLLTSEAGLAGVAMLSAMSPVDVAAAGYDTNVCSSTHEHRNSEMRVGPMVSKYHRDANEPP